MLRDRYGIVHTTIQFESTKHAGHEGFCACPPGSCETLYCELQPADELSHDEAGQRVH